jgi:hypothetical protein
MPFLYSTGTQYSYSQLPHNDRIPESEIVAPVSHYCTTTTIIRSKTMKVPTTSTTTAAAVAGAATRTTVRQAPSSLSTLPFMDLAGEKLRQQRRRTLCESASAPVSSFAVAQLEKMGWSKGTGLGKKRHGVTTHITVVQRPEAAGLGTATEASIQLQEQQNEWWKDSLGDTLAKLGGNKKKKRKTYTDDELFEATGGARFGMRAGNTRNLAKWRRTESELSTVSESLSNTESNRSEEEAAVTKKQNKSAEQKMDESSQNEKLSREERKEKKRLKRKRSA